MNQLLCFGAISTHPAKTNTSDTSFSVNQDSSSKADSTPLENTGNSEMMGMSVFKNDKLVGELDAKETLCYLLIRNEVESCIITIPNPEDSNNSIDLYIYNKSKPKIKVKIINGSPLITVNLKLEAKILSIDANSNYMTKERIPEISNSANQYIEALMNNYLYKTAKQFKSDINGFGKYATNLFTTMKDFEEYNWLENYQNSFFDINVDTKIQSALLLSGN